MKQKYRVWMLMLADIVLINLSIIFAYLLRFDGQQINYFPIYRNMAVIFTLIKIGVFYYFGLYKSLWRYASINELVSVVVATAIGNLSVIAYGYFIQPSYIQQVLLPIPRSIYVITWMLDILFIGGMRFAYRVLRHWNVREIWKSSHKKRVLIVGAGDAGAMVIREMKNHEELGMMPVAVIDDDIVKHDKKINNIPIIGTRYRIEEAVIQKHRYDYYRACPWLKRIEERLLKYV